MGTSPADRPSVEREALASTFDRLVEIIARLRDPETGCPWDRQQDHHSLRPYVVEEAHELVHAIDGGDPAMIADELGDLLLQVVLHSQIASERGDFSVADVIQTLIAKLERRHPHVFGEASSDLPSVARRWREIKAKEGRYEKAQPALVRAKRLLYALRVQERSGSVDDQAASLSGEEGAGMRLLAELQRTVSAGFDPEIALTRALDRLEDTAP